MCFCLYRFDLLNYVSDIDNLSENLSFSLLPASMKVSKKDMSTFNVNEVDEMVDMLAAARSYQNNVEVMNTAKQLMMKTLDLTKV